MGLKEFQTVMARLATERAYCQRFAADAVGEGEKAGLSETEVQQLTELFPEAIPQFSRSLLRKRYGEVREMLPASAAALGESFWNLFEEFAADRPTRGGQRHRDDALEFADWLLGRDSLPQTGEPLRQLLLFEREDLGMWKQKRGIRIRFFRHDLGETLCRLRDGDQDVGYHGPPMMAVWIRLGPDWRVGYREFVPRLWFK
ncbi:MAG: hypothetical protein ACPGVU_24775 [Limisphaerales bacterium]